jgi:hypothetical protein
MVTIVISRAWAQRGQTEFEADAGRLPDIIKGLADAEPNYRRRLLDEHGELYGYLSIFIDAEEVPRELRSTVDVADDSTITIVPPLAGG